MGYEELHTVTNVKIALGLITCGLALLARGGTFHPVLLHPKHIRLMTTPRTVHGTNRVTPGSGGNPSRACGQKHELMTAGVVRETTLTPGSERAPTRRRSSIP
jgi:hypothetical protein